MRLFLLSLMVLSTFIIHLHAQVQDTIFVQTLVFDSTGRSGMFHFPEASQGPFEKILMYYGMRCHDAAVGNGNVGCREWDYSCNTFIVDSSRADSTMRTIPDYVINNLEDDFFTWRTRPTHHYIQRSLRYGKSNGGSGKRFIRLDGEETGSIDFASATQPTKHVWVYSADQLTTSGLQPGKIYGLRLPLDKDGVLTRVYIGMKWLTDTQDIHQKALLKKQLNQVFWGDISVKSGNADCYFDTPIEWDGNSSLVIHLDVPVQHSGDFGIKTISATGVTSARSSGVQKALWLTGAQWIDLPEQAFRQVDSAITISFWAYGFAPLIPKQNTTLFEAVDANANRQINIHLPWSNGTVYWDCGGVGSNYDRISKKAKSEDIRGRWNHWAFTKDVHSGTMRIYLNGDLWMEGSGKTRAIGRLDKRVLGMNVQHSLHYNGRIRDFAIWNTALDGGQMESIMRSPLHSTKHPVVYYALQSGSTTLKDKSGNGWDIRLSGLPESYYTLRRGEYFMPENTALIANSAPTVRLIKGNLQVDKEEQQVLDTIENIKHMVIHYQIREKKPVPIDTQYLYNAIEEPVYNVEGEQVDYVDIEDADGDFDIGSLSYYSVSPATFELLSLVTPYGNGLDLGPKGVFFTFDVSDFAPVLQGNKKLYVAYGAQQEELDIRFAFIKGSPARKVLDISNVWPAGRGYFNQISTDEVFEPRPFQLRDDADMAKVRLTITGHQQNGEFVRKNHYLNVNGGTKEFNWDVWKECSTVPIHPQGGTWLLDRAGWCPGDPSLVTYHTITPLVQPGAPFTLDYGVNGVGLKEANYLVASQLIQYGPLLKDVDAEIMEVVRPSNRVEYLRYNPDCVSPEIIVRNTGRKDIRSLTIRYGVHSGSPLVTQWQGTLNPEDTAHISLPVTTSSFWATATKVTSPVFDVEITKVNGATDSYTANNIYHEPFTLPDIIDKKVIRLEYRTNSRGNETSYTLKDRSGHILYEADRLEKNTTYKELLELGPGCYSLQFNDRGDDGLYFWFWERTDPRGRGYAKINYERSKDRWRTVKSFNPDFGRFFKYDFAYQSLNATKDPSGIRTVITHWPNPVIEQLHLRVSDIVTGGKISIVVRDLFGRNLIRRVESLDGSGEHLFYLPVSGLAAGRYLLELKLGGKTYASSFIKTQ